MNDALTSFLTAYFHQDWKSEFSNSLDAVNEFISTSPEELRIQLLCEVELLLYKKDLKEDLVWLLGGNFRPESEGFTIKLWLQEIERALQESMGFK